MEPLQESNTAVVEPYLYLFICISSIILYIYISYHKSMMCKWCSYWKWVFPSAILDCRRVQSSATACAGHATSFVQLALNRRQLRQLRPQVPQTWYGHILILLDRSNTFGYISTRCHGRCRCPRFTPGLSPLVIFCDPFFWGEPPN